MILRYVFEKELNFTAIHFFKLTLMSFNKFIEEVKKKTILISVKQKRERTHNFIEVENEITYGESIVNKSRTENLIIFRHFTIDVAYPVL